MNLLLQADKSSLQSVPLSRSHIHVFRIYKPIRWGNTVVLEKEEAAAGRDVVFCLELINLMSKSY